MKRIAYCIFLAALLSSCGPSHPLNAIRVQNEDSKKWQDFYLLQDHDTEIVAYSSDQRKDLSEVLPLEKMQRIAFQGQTTAGQWIGAFGGFFVGASIVTANNRISNVVYPASFALGWYIGHWLTDRWIELDPYSLETRELLQSRSKYFDKK